MNATVIDQALNARSPFIRKGMALGLQIAGRLLTPTSDAPPVIVNSLPKSGTHLLLQLVRALPGIRHRGSFIASTPSLTLRPRSQEALLARIDRVAPGEAVGAHLHHDAIIGEAIRDIGALNLFIYRDPRAVLISEIHYLTHMNRWHRMHRPFTRARDFDARLDLALHGQDARYPGASQRFGPYLPWRDDPDTHVLRYEDLTGPQQADTLAALAGAYQNAAGDHSGTAAMITAMGEAIDPARSHTFRRGGAQTWRDDLSPGQIARIDKVLGPMVEAFGYGP